MLSFSDGRYSGVGMPAISSRWCAIFAIPPMQQQWSIGCAVSQLTELRYLRFFSNPEQIRPEMFLQLDAPAREGREIVEAIHDIVAHP